MKLKVSKIEKIDDIPYRAITEVIYLWRMGAEGEPHCVTLANIPVESFKTPDEATTFANMLALSYAQFTELSRNGVADPILMHGLEQVDDYKWALKAYGEVVDGQRYQALRFLEEACELVQTQGLSRQDIDLVANHVFDRPAGTEVIEIGDVLICLNILAMTRFRNAAACRVECHKKLANRTPEELRAKDKAKMDAGLI